jgi:uncharacterized membrane protein
MQTLSELQLFFSRAASSGWEFWPFGPGYGGGWGPVLARYGFALVLLVLVALFLRLLFGPGGRLRPKEFGTEHIQRRKERKEKLKSLKARRKRGEISPAEYFEARQRLMSDERG